MAVDNSYLASLEQSLAELVYDSWQGTITRMTFGTINIEKSLVARRNTAESKTDDRGQLIVGNSYLASLEPSLAELVYDC